MRHQWGRVGVPVRGRHTHLKGQLIAAIVIEFHKIDPANFRAQARGDLANARGVVEEGPRVRVFQRAEARVDVVKRNQGRVVLVPWENGKQVSILVLIFLLGLLWLVWSQRKGGEGFGNCLDGRHGDLLLR